MDLEPEEEEGIGPITIEKVAGIDFGTIGTMHMTLMEMNLSGSLATAEGHIDSKENKLHSRCLRHNRTQVPILQGYHLALKQILLFSSGQLNLRVYLIKRVIR